MRSLTTRAVFLFMALTSMISIAVFTSCGNRQSGKTDTEFRNAGGDNDTLCLPLPVAPRYADSEEKRYIYMADRYWDPVDWNDTLLLKSDKFMGGSMANYGVLLSAIDEKRRPGVVTSLINRNDITPAGYRALEEYSYKYFYYPGSPQYDAELYLLFVNALLGSGKCDDATVERLLARRGEIMKNRVGHQAAVFEYVGSNGKRERFSPGGGEADVTFLMLYDPECEVCAEAVKIMTSSKAFSAAVESGEASVYAINAYGSEDVKGKVISDFPASWHTGYSPGGEIEREDIYVVRSTPAIYVIDKEGIILEKDISLDRLAQITGEQ